MAGKKNNTAIKNSPKHLLGIQNLSIIEAKEILEEANAYNMRKEVDEQAKNHLKNDPLFSKLEAYIYAYNDLIEDNE